MAPSADASARPSAPSRSWFRVALLGTLSAGAVLTLVILVYELARARVPEHRAALEHLVRVQTGLDIRFTELALRWGWYGPEAVFRDVELDEPGSAEALLRAPELVVGFDAWRTLRSGHPEAGRIELVAPEIDFASAGDRHVMRSEVPGSAARARDRERAQARSVLDRVAVLQRWRGGRIDIDGGTLRLPDPGNSAKSLDIQIRRASLHRSEDEWNVAGLVFLPDRMGRSARIALRVTGDLGVPDALSGTLRVEARRLQFPGVHEIAAGLPALAPLVPGAGSGDVTVDVDFKQGALSRVNGSVHAGALVFDSPMAARLLVLDRVTGGWHAARTGSGWRIRLHSPELLTGTLAGLPLSAAIQALALEWDPERSPGDRLRAAGRFERVALGPPSRDFALDGLAVDLSGTESQLLFNVQSRTARLDWEQSQQVSLLDVRVSAPLRLSAGPQGWRLDTDEIALEHQRASIRLSGLLAGGRRDATSAAGTRIQANGSLDGVEIPLVMGLLGEDTARAFGAVASHLTSGRIHNGEFAVSGPVSELPFADAGSGFRGSLTLRNATLSGGDLWPDADEVDARVQWRGARIQVSVDSGHAGQFQLASAKAEWDATGASPTRLTGHVNGRLEEALAWVRDHPRLQDFTPDLRDIDAKGEATFDFNVSIPADVADGARQTAVLARVSTFMNGASVPVVSGLPPVEGVTGAFVFDAGRVQRTALTGTWLGGPVTLRIGERREKGTRSVIVQAQGILKSEQLAALANAAGTVDGPAEWNGELSYQQLDGRQSPRWNMRIDSNLLGVSSNLAEPFAKSAVVALPVHLEVSGSADAAQMRADLGERMRSVFALRRRADSAWTVDRGSVRFGGAAAVLPSEAAVILRGRVGQLDLPAYVLAWQQLKKESLPAIRAQLAAGQMWVAGHSFTDVSLRADHTASGTDLLVDSAQLSGMARWPQLPASARSGGSPIQAAELHLTRVDLPDGTLPGDAVGTIAAFGPNAQIAVDELNWRGRSLGRVTASVVVNDDLVVADDLRLVNGTQQGHGSLRCHTDRPGCRLTFALDSIDAAATLADFGLAADVSAASASLDGALEWSPTAQQSWLASLHGTLGMRLADGALLSGGSAPEGAHPFALFAVPALVRGLEVPGSAGAPLAHESGDLHFARLEADFELRDGAATTANLHFDGDAEILMRGRTGLVARDYDQQVWVLRGEERLPAAVRRFGATPRVAAAWLSLRDLFSGSAEKDRSRAVLRLQGTWDDPMVVAEN